jgi:ribosomal protein S18
LLKILGRSSPRLPHSPLAPLTATTATAAPKPRTRKVKQQQLKQAEEAPASIQVPPVAAAAAEGVAAARLSPPPIPYEQYQRDAQELKDFINEHGRYPSKSTSADSAEITLAWRYQYQKKSFNNGALSSLKEQCLIDTMGSREWQQNVRAKLDFDDMVRRVKKWVAEHNGQLPPYSAVDEDGVNLGMWVQNRRREYKKGSLEPKQIQALESIPGWQNGKGRVTFGEGLIILKAYVRMHGRIPSNSTTGDRGGLNLGRWTKMRRENKRAGKLSAARVKALEQVDGWYWEWPGQ